MRVSPFCFVIGVEFSVIFGGGKLTINEIKRNCILNTLEIFYLHILYFPSERKTKNTKSTPIDKKQSTPSSSWRQEPRSITDLFEAQQSLVPEYCNHLHQIRTSFSCKNRTLDCYNFHQPQELITHLNNIFTDQSTVFKLNVSFGFILCNKETRALQYYYASRKNEQVFEEPFQITTAADLQQVHEALLNLNVLEWVCQWRPNSKWVVEQVTNITFFVTKLRGHPIGRGTYLPSYLAKNHGLVALDRNCNNGKVYSDNLCFFRALALHNGCHPKNLERDAQHYYEWYREFSPEKNKFFGVKLKELTDLEHTFLSIPLKPPSPMEKREMKTILKKKIQYQTLLHNWFTAPFATTQVLFTSTCTRITFPVWTISRSIPSPTAARDV